MPYLIVETRFEPPVTDDELRTFGLSLRPCMEMRGVRKLRTWLAEDRTFCLCEFEAADQESLRDAYRSAGIRWSRMFRGTLWEGEP